MSKSVKVHGPLTIKRIDEDKKKVNNKKYKKDENYICDNVKDEDTIITKIQTNLFISGNYKCKNNQFVFPYCSEKGNPYTENYGENFKFLKKTLYEKIKTNLFDKKHGRKPFLSEKLKDKKEFYESSPSPKKFKEYLLEDLAPVLDKDILIVTHSNLLKAFIKLFDYNKNPKSQKGGSRDEGKEQEDITEQEQVEGVAIAELEKNDVKLDTSGKIKIDNLDVLMVVIRGELTEDKSKLEYKIVNSHLYRWKNNYREDPEHKYTLTPSFEKIARKSVEENPGLNAFDNSDNQQDSYVPLYEKRIYLMRHCVACHNTIDGGTKVGHAFSRMRGGESHHGFGKYSLCLTETVEEISGNKTSLINLINRNQQVRQPNGNIIGFKGEMANCYLGSSISLRAILTAMLLNDIVAKPTESELQDREHLWLNS